MVSLSRIYTRTGDQGQTRLADNSVSSKTDVRMDAYGTVDEANCAIGVAMSLAPPELVSVLSAIQNELFDLGADLATPVVEQAKVEPPCVAPTRVAQTSIDQLEAWCDRFGAGLPALRSFVLPGGSALAAQLNVARTVVRRAEREGWRAADSVAINRLALQYLNRLSDLLFILGRWANAEAGVPETLWVPGVGPATNAESKLPPTAS